ncbi:MAG: ATP synthase F0 subunit B [Acidobacteria bacterium]|nr:ATP synthase F0 subunit B [Acidobacteriota bacterium]
MKILRIAGLLALAAGPVLAAEEGGPGHELLFRAINFVVLAGFLGYLLKKYAGPFFAARGEAITKEIREARKLLEQSDQRARAIDERLLRLDQEIAQLRAAGQAEIAAEHARIERETEQAVRKVFTQAEQEMAAAAKTARLELKAYVASLAISLAEQKIAGRVTPQTQRDLVGAFVREL